jgi:hypothetical protein
MAPIFATMAATDRDPPTHPPPIHPRIHSPSTAQHIHNKRHPFGGCFGRRSTGGRARSGDRERLPVLSGFHSGLPAHQPAHELAVCQRHGAPAGNDNSQRTTLTHTLCDVVVDGLPVCCALQRGAFALAREYAVARPPLPRVRLHQHGGPSNVLAARAPMRSSGFAVTTRVCGGLHPHRIPHAPPQAELGLEASNILGWDAAYKSRGVPPVFLVVCNPARVSLLFVQSLERILMDAAPTFSYLRLRALGADSCGNQLCVCAGEATSTADPESVNDMPVRPTERPALAAGCVAADRARSHLKRWSTSRTTLNSTGSSTC